MRSATRNYVAKHARTFNKSHVFRDRKSDYRRSDFSTKMLVCTECIELDCVCELLERDPWPDDSETDW